MAENTEKKKKHEKSAECHAIDAAAVVAVYFLCRPLPASCRCHAYYACIMLEVAMVRFVFSFILLCNIDRSVESFRAASCKFKSVRRPATFTAAAIRTSYHVQQQSHSSRIMLCFFVVTCASTPHLSGVQPQEPCRCKLGRFSTTQGLKAYQQLSKQQPRDALFAPRRPALMNSRNKVRGCYTLVRETRKSCSAHDLACLQR